MIAGFQGQEYFILTGFPKDSMLHHVPVTVSLLSEARIPFSVNAPSSAHLLFCQIHAASTFQGLSMTVGVRTLFKNLFSILLRNEYM